MKKWKLICALFLAVWMSTGVFCTPASTLGPVDNSQNVTTFKDGSYVVTTITYDAGPMVSGQTTAEQISGTKQQSYYKSNHTLAWTFRVHGSFTYDGYHAEAIDADYSYEISDSAWSFNGGNAYCSGATATATGSFTLLFSPSTVTITLTCSPTGVLS